jgi:mannosylglycoprotein endo-beta-mannosidase
MHHKKLMNKDWKHVEERFHKRLNCWRSNLLSVGGRLVLINSILSSLPMFLLSFFEIPRGVLKKLDYFRSRFFLQNDEHKKKYRLTKWEIVCTSKDQGGLGVLNLGVHNRCLLSKWLFRLLNEDGIWQQLLRNKYLRDKTLTQVQYLPGDSQFWAGLMKVKEEFLSLGKFDLGDGSQVRFWEDVWIRPRPLKSLFPALYNIVRKKSASVRTVFSMTPLNVAFRRSLVDGNLQAWYEVVAMVADA